MKEEEYFHSSIQIRDGLFKVGLYISKISDSLGPDLQIQKTCHLAADTCLKFCDNEQFSKQICQKLQSIIQQTKNYFILYVMDILLKNNKFFLKLARKDLQQNFKMVWDRTWKEPKNTFKLECLKTMVKTWGLLYNQQIQQNLQKWLQIKYNTSLILEKKNQQLFNDAFAKYFQKKPSTASAENNDSKKEINSQMDMLEPFHVQQRKLK